MTNYEKGLFRAIEIIEQNKRYLGAISLQELQDEILKEIGKNEPKFKTAKNPK